MTGRDEIKQKCANMALHLHEVFWKSLAGLVESEVLNETIEKRGEIWKSAVLSWGVATDSDSKGSPK